MEEEGFEVLEAEDGMFGFEVVKANQDFAIVLSDINMSGVDGISMF